MCHHARHHTADRPVARSARPERSDVRASDSEREQVVTLLRDHGAAGRLEVEELDERVEAAYGARTRADLRALLDDLPEDREAPARGVARPHADRRPPAPSALAIYALVSVVLVMVWALTGAGGFWPAWFIGFGALAVFKHGRHRHWTHPPRPRRAPFLA